MPLNPWTIGVKFLRCKVIMGMYSFLSLSERLTRLEISIKKEAERIDLNFEIRGKIDKALKFTCIVDIWNFIFKIY